MIDPAPEEMTADLPGFRQPKTMPATDPLDQEATTVTAPTPAAETTSWPNEGDDGGSASDESFLSSTAAATPSRASTADPEAFEQLFAIPISVTGIVLNKRLAAPGTAHWLFLEDEAESIAGPLARIAARHTPVGPGEANDIADGIEATAAATAYVLRNISAQRADAQWAAQAEQEQEQTA